VTVNLNHIENNTALSSDGRRRLYLRRTAPPRSPTTASRAIRPARGGGASISTIATAPPRSPTTASRAIRPPHGGGAYIFAHQHATATLTNNSITGNTVFGGGASITGGGGQYGYLRGGAYITAPPLSPTTALRAIRPAPIGGAYLRHLRQLHPHGTATLGQWRWCLTPSVGNTHHGQYASTGGGLHLSPQRNENPTDSAALYNNLFWANRATDNRGARTSGSTTTATATTSRPRSPCSPTTSTNQRPALASRYPITIDPSNLNKLDPLFVDANTPVTFASRPARR
jgi:hypothetical protein